MIAAGGSKKERLPIYQCTNCGHGFTPLDVDAKVIARWYQHDAPDHTFIAEEKARRTTAQAVLKRIESYQERPGQLLDVGAGPGIFVSEAVRHGWDATGIEPSAWAVRHGRQTYGIPMIQGDISRLEELAAESYDVVTLFDVIEHVTDPAELLQAAVARLRPGGLLVLTTPRFDSILARLMGKRWYCIFPAHIHYFTRPSLDLSLRAAGCKIINARAHTRYLGAGYFWERLKAFLAGGLEKVSSHHPSSISIPLNFGDEFEMYAEKDAI